MMKAIRFLILVTIIGLVALAFMMQSAENPDRQNAIEAFLQPLAEMQQKIEQSYPQLSSDLEQLKNDIVDRMAGVDPQKLIPIHLPTASSPLPAEMQAPVEDKPATPEENLDLNVKVEDLAEQLKNMDANELAQRMKALYEKLERHTGVKEATGAVLGDR